MTKKRDDKSRLFECDEAFNDEAGDNANGSASNTQKKLQADEKTASIEASFSDTISDLNRLIEAASFCRQNSNSASAEIVERLLSFNDMIEQVRHKSVTAIFLHLNMNEEKNFTRLIRAFSELMSDKYEAAAICSVAVSTFYRWKSGDVIPHLAFRKFVQRQIVDCFFGEGTGIALLPANPPVKNEGSDNKTHSTKVSGSFRALLN